MNILYFVDARGQSPVKKFIDSLPLQEQAKVFAYIEELRKQGHNLRIYNKLEKHSSGAKP